MSKFTPKDLPSKTAGRKIGSYQLNDKFSGYMARTDQTMIGSSFLVTPSQNVVMNTSGRVGLVKGYMVDGTSSTVIDSGILSNYDFTTFKGSVRNLRAGFLTTAGNDGRLQYRYVTGTSTVNWVNLKNSLSNVVLSYTDFWNTTEKVNEVLWVDGTSNIFAWNGAVTTLSSVNNTAGYIATLNAAPTASGAGYVVGDVVTITGGTATATVLTVSGANTGSITSVDVGFGGINYVVGDILTVPGGSGTATLKVTAIAGSGTIVSASVVTVGTGYALNTYFNPTGGSGTTANAWTISGLGGQGVLTLGLTTTASGYSAGAGVATTGGSGAGLTVNITAVATGSITKQGTTTWAQEGFYTSTNLSVTISGIRFAYTTIVGSVMVGITPTPVTPAFVAGTIVHQTPVTTALSSMTAIPSTYTPTVVSSSAKVQLYLGSSTSNDLYISKTGSYIDYTFSSPARLSGEGAKITLDAPAVKFIPQENRDGTNSFDVWISAGKDRWCIVRSTINTTFNSSGVATNVSESLDLIRLKVASLQGAKSERLATKMKNHIVFVGNDNVVNAMGFIPYQYVPVIQDISYPIIDDQNSYDLTYGSLFYYKNYIYEAVPKSGIIRIYNMTDQTHEQFSNYNPIEQVNASQPWFWEAPVLYPITGFYVVNGEIYGHGFNTSESYKLFTGGSFNGQQIEALAAFGFDDKGDRTTTKLSDECWVEGYIKQNTNLACTVVGDLGSFQSTQTNTVNGNDPGIVSYGTGGHALGKNNLGTSPLGGATNISSDLPAWFHVVLTYGPVPFYIEQIQFYTKGVDLDWQLLVFGTNATPTAEGNNDLNR